MHTMETAYINSDCNSTGLPQSRSFKIRSFYCLFRNYHVTIVTMLFLAFFYIKIDNSYSKMFSSKKKRVCEFSRIPSLEMLPWPWGN